MKHQSKTLAVKSFHNLLCTQSVNHSENFVGLNRQTHTLPVERLKKSILFCRTLEAMVQGYSLDGIVSNGYNLEWLLSRKILISNCAVGHNR